MKFDIKVLGLVNLVKVAADELKLAQLPKMQIRPNINRRYPERRRARQQEAHPSLKGDSLVKNSI